MYLKPSLSYSSWCTNVLVETRLRRNQSIGRCALTLGWSDDLIELRRRCRITDNRY